MANFPQTNAATLSTSGIIGKSVDARMLQDFLIEPATNIEQVPNMDRVPASLTVVGSGANRAGKLAAGGLTFGTGMIRNISASMLQYFDTDLVPDIENVPDYDAGTPVLLSVGASGSSRTGKLAASGLTLVSSRAPGAIGKGVVGALGPAATISNRTGHQTIAGFITSGSQRRAITNTPVLAVLALAAAGVRQSGKIVTKAITLFAFIPGSQFGRVVTATIALGVSMTKTARPRLLASLSTNASTLRTLGHQVIAPISLILLSLKRAAHQLSGNLSLTGTQIRSAGKVVAGTLATVASAVKQTSAVRSVVISWFTIVSGAIRALTITTSAAISLSAAAQRRAGVARSAGLTFAPTVGIARLFTRLNSAALSLAASIQRRSGITQIASLASAVTSIPSRSFALLNAVIISLLKTVRTQISKPSSTTTTILTGNSARQAAKFSSAGMTLTPSAGFSQIGKAALASLATAGSDALLIARNIIGSIVLTPSVAKRMPRGFSAQIATSATASAVRAGFTFFVNVAASLGAAASMAKAMIKPQAAAWGIGATAPRRAIPVARASLSTSGTMIQRTAHATKPQLAAVGSQIRGRGIAIFAALSTAASQIRYVYASSAGVISTSATIARQLLREFRTGLTFSATITRARAQAILAAIQIAVSAIYRDMHRGPAAIVGLVPALGLRVGAGALASMTAAASALRARAISIQTALVMLPKQARSVATQAQGVIMAAGLALGRQIGHSAAATGVLGATVATGARRSIMFAVQVAISAAQTRISPRIVVVGAQIFTAPTQMRAIAKTVRGSLITVLKDRHAIVTQPFLAALTFAGALTKLVRTRARATIGITAFWDFLGLWRLRILRLLGRATPTLVVQGQPPQECLRLTTNSLTSAVSFKGDVE